MNVNKTEKIGEISEAVINTLQLNILAPTPIFIGETNLLHMKQKHPKDYDKYNNLIGDIINFPDFVGINKKNSSIEYVKEIFDLTTNEYVKVAVRVTTNGQYFARTLYSLNKNRVQNFIDKGYLKKIQANMNNN